MQSGFSYYDLLGVDASASQQEIQAAYRAAILKYHPDVNSAPNASRLSEMLNLAYETLKDEKQRAEYDQACSNPRSAEANNRKEADLLHEWPLLSCDFCQRIFVHLRYALFYRVWSILIYTRMGPVGGVVCPHCRSKLSWQTALFSSLLGPWGFPWGLIYTARASFASWRAGEKPRQQNGQLLRHQGMAFLVRGHITEAFTNLTMSLKYEKQKHVIELLQDPVFNNAQTMPTAGWKKGQTASLVISAASVLLILTLFTIIGNSSEPSSTQTQAAPQASNGPSSDSINENSFPANLGAEVKSCRSLPVKSLSANAVAYSQCHLALREMDALKGKATGVERDYIELDQAELQTYTAVGAAAAGDRSTARSLFDESTATFKRLANSAIAPSVRKTAGDWYDCNVNNKCNGS